MPNRCTQCATHGQHHLRPYNHLTVKAHKNANKHALLHVLGGKRMVPTDVSDTHWSWRRITNPRFQTDIVVNTTRYQGSKQSDHVNLHMYASSQGPLSMSPQGVIHKPPQVRHQVQNETNKHATDTANSPRESPNIHICRKPNFIQSKRSGVWFK